MAPAPQKTERELARDVIKTNKIHFRFIATFARYPNRKKIEYDITLRVRLQRKRTTGHSFSIKKHTHTHTPRQRNLHSIHSHHSVWIYDIHNRRLCAANYFVHVRWPIGIRWCVELMHVVHVSPHNSIGMHFIIDIRTAVGARWWRAMLSLGNLYARRKSEFRAHRMSTETNQTNGTQHIPVDDFRVEILRIVYFYQESQHLGVGRRCHRFVLMMVAARRRRCRTRSRHVGLAAAVAIVIVVGVGRHRGLVSRIAACLLHLQDGSRNGTRNVCGLSVGVFGECTIVGSVRAQRNFMRYSCAQLKVCTLPCASCGTACGGSLFTYAQLARNCNKPLRIMYIFHQYRFDSSCDVHSIVILCVVVVVVVRLIKKPDARLTEKIYVVRVNRWRI